MQVVGLIEHVTQGDMQVVQTLLKVEGTNGEGHTVIHLF